MNSNTKTARNASCFQTSGTLLLSLKGWASVPENFPYGLGALILNYTLYQSELVPRWISVWGLVGAILLLAMGFLRLYGRPVEYLAIPIILNELVLAGWLIAYGFESFASTSVIVGVLIIAALISTILNGVFIKSMNRSEYLSAVAADEKNVLTGVIFQLALTASVVAIPIILFPILREHGQSIALGYVVARIFEGFFDVIIAISQLLLLTLSREFIKTDINRKNEQI